MTKDEIDNLHVLLYSHKQKCFHRMTLRNDLNDGINSILGHRKAPSDWIPVSVAPDKSDFVEIANVLRDQIDGKIPLQPKLPVER